MNRLASSSDGWAGVQHRAGTFHRGGALDEALAVLSKGVRTYPGNPALLNDFGLLLLEKGRAPEAVKVFKAVLALLPASGAAHFNLANAVRAAGNPARAIFLYRQALKFGTVLPEVFNNLGLAHRDLGDMAAAREAYGDALGLDPHYVPAAMNWSYALVQDGRPSEAVGLLRDVICARPEYADAHWLLSHALLLLGEYREGWREYEWRWAKMPVAPYRRTDPARQWHGEDLHGRRILLYAEQGLGDAVQFIRYAPLVADRGGSVVVECHEELVALFCTVQGVQEVYARGSPVPLCDVECPLLSLPAVFGTTVATIPAVVPYLHAGEERVRSWKTKIAEATASLRVGLVWAGSARHRNDANRSLPPGGLIPLGSLDKVRFYSLQKGDSADTRVRVPRGLVLTDVSQELPDLAETAAAVQALDLVVTVDTAVAHVAGAVGVPVWLLVPYAPDWRWMLGWADTPWYPSMRIFRQGAPGAWGAVIADLVDRLRALAPSS